MKWHCPLARAWGLGSRALTVSAFRCGVWNSGYEMGFSQVGRVVEVFGGRFWVWILSAHASQPLRAPPLPPPPLPNHHRRAC